MIFSSMITNRAKQIKRAMSILLSVIVIIALSATMVGTICEADCEVDCQEESGAGCVCICCPNNIVMSQSDDNSNKLEFLTCQWTFACLELLGEQEWFINIDHPPQNIF